MSLPNSFNKSDVGVITRKKTIPITIGETILPKNNPNLNQSLFKGDNMLEFIIPNTKKIMAIDTDHNLISLPLNIG